MTGTTPFERSDALRAEGERRITTAYATSQLVKVLQECDTMIELWHSSTQRFLSDINSAYCYLFYTKERA